ncbi:MAG TPA: GTP cyclohydrolase II [Methylovorus sp.]|nr:GTP cyclohydrolase II [Methylovorus sp.]
MRSSEAQRFPSQPLIERIASAPLPTRHGEFELHVYREPESGIEHVALVAGQVQHQQQVLLRLHSECLTGDVFGSSRCDCGEQLQRSQELIAEAELGVLVYLRGQEGRGIGLANKIRAYQLQDQGLDTVEANLALGLPVDSRRYDAAMAILHDLQVRSVQVLSNNPDKLQCLAENGFAPSQKSLRMAAGLHNRQYLETKRLKLGHWL